MSPAPPASTSSAFLLRSVDYGEADRIVTLLTEDLGKVSAIARGARRSRKRFGGTLEPCALIAVELGTTRGSLRRLASSRVVRAYPALLTKLERIQAIGRASELVRRATPDDDPEPELFVAFASLHERIADGAEVERALLAFSLRLLALLGLAPQLDVCAVSGVSCPADQRALFDPARGGIVRQRFGGGPHSLSASTRARMLTAMGPEWAEAVESWTEEELSEAGPAIERFLVAHQLRGPTGK